MLTELTSNTRKRRQNGPISRANLNLNNRRKKKIFMLKKKLKSLRLTLLSH